MSASTPHQPPSLPSLGSWVLTPTGISARVVSTQPERGEVTVEWTQRGRDRTWIEQADFKASQVRQISL